MGTTFSGTLNGQPITSSEVMTAMLAMLGIIVALALVIWVLLIIAYWKMFTKAGEKGWKSIIPIYNIYVAFTLCWKDGAKQFLIYLIPAVVVGILSGTTTVNGTTTTYAASNPVLGVLASVAGIVCLVWYVRFCIKMAHAYNKGTGCGILSIFFPNILTLYYGFASSATYQGPQD